jgi:spermidine/putrescine transport system substrate-binding protein
VQVSLVIILLIVLAACGTEPEESPATGEARTGDATPATGIEEGGAEEQEEEARSSEGTGEVFVGNCTVGGPLRLFNWSEYMDPELMAEFGELYGIEVAEDNFSSNEELIDKLHAGNSGYDLVFPSDYAVGILAEEGLLAELDRDNIPNFENLNPDLTGLYYDPDNTYSVPFQWGTTGIAYNESYFESPPDSWAVLFEPEAAGAEGFFSMLDDEREAIGAALKFLGYSVNDTDPTHIEEAKQLLLQQKQLGNFSGYNSDSFSQTLAGEEVYYAHAWSGNAALAASENEAIRYVIPQEGGVIWQDNIAIPEDAPNKCTAELFINFLIAPENAARLSDYTYYNTPVPAALDLLDPATEELLSRGFTPGEEEMARLEWIQRAEDTTIFSDTWTEVKSR